MNEIFRRDVNTDAGGTPQIESVFVRLAAKSDIL
jgi:hypothetical protein